MRALDSYKPVINSVNVGAFVVELGGKYAFSAAATGSGTIELEVLGPDNATYVKLYKTGSASADFEDGILYQNGQKVLNLCPGTYKVVVTTFTAAYVELARIPGE